MSDPRSREGVRRAVAAACGVAAGTYVYRRRRRRRAVSPSPVANLSARQAMTVFKLAHVLGIVAMAVFAAYYVDAMMRF